MNEILLQLFHIIFVGGFLFYIGINRTNVHPFLFNILLGLGIIIFCYHAYRATTKKNPWINLIHIFIIAPLLVYIGYQREKTPRYAFEILLMLSITAIGYNGYYLIQENIMTTEKPNN
jgi:hypothetical protein